MKFSPLVFFFGAACTVGNFWARFPANGAIYAADGAVSTVNSSKFDAVAAGAMQSMVLRMRVRSRAQNSDGAMT